MLGMVFTEFVDMVESRFSPDIADRMLTQADLPHGGAYTAVGYYPHDEIVQLVRILSTLVEMPAPVLVQAFGKRLATVFAVGHPAAFQSQPTLLDLLASVDAEIHKSVRKLYPQAQLPSFETVGRTDRELRLAYSSPRSMEDLAVGLIEGCADYYATPVSIDLQPLPDRAHGTLFTIRLA